MKITCNINHRELEGDYGTVDGVTATCSRCGNETESYGTGDRSVKRCLVVMREECLNSESNYYVEEEETHND